MARHHSWNADNMQAKFDVNHHPAKIKEASLSERPSRHGGRRGDGWTSNGIMLVLGIALLYGLIWGLLRL